MPLLSRPQSLNLHRKLEEQRAAAVGPRPFRGPGSAWYHGRHSHVRAAGPASAAELSNWPVDLSDAIWGGNTAESRARKACAVALLVRGVVIHSDFSGKRSHEAAFRVHSFAMHYHNMFMPPLHQWLRFHRSCDPAEACRKIARWGSYPAAHIFHDVSDYFPASVITEVERLRPNAAADLMTKLNSMDDIEQTLRWTSDRGVFKKSPHAPCAVHTWKEEGCPVFATDVGGSHIVSCAGTMCTPWSKCGNRLGFAHPDMESHYKWESITSGHCKHHGLDMCHLEQSDQFPLDDQIRWMHDRGMTTLAIRLAPSDIGWPIHGRRSFAFSFRDEKFACLAPLDPIRLRAHFMSIFHRRVRCDGEVFCNNANTTEQREARCANFAPSKRRRHVHAAAGDIMQAPLESLCSGSLLQRVKASLTRCATHSGASGTMMCDLTQNPEKMNACGPWMPRPRRNTQIACFKGVQDRVGYIMTPREMSFAMGWPSVATAENTPWRHLVSNAEDETNINYTQQVQMTGGGIHLALLFAWLLYVHSHIVERATLLRFQPAPTADLSLWSAAVRIARSRSSLTLGSNGDADEGHDFEMH